MQDSIFTKIIKGEIPCHKIYEDEKTLAFLDIHPATDGHALVIPKQQVEFIWDLPAEEYGALMETVRKVGQRLRAVIKDKNYVGQVVIGTDVPHAHVHVVPFNESSELKRSFETSVAEPDHEALARVAKKLHFS